MSWLMLGLVLISGLLTFSVVSVLTSLFVFASFSVVSVLTSSGILVLMVSSSILFIGGSTLRLGSVFKLVLTFVDSISLSSVLIGFASLTVFASAFGLSLIWLVLLIIGFTFGVSLMVVLGSVAVVFNLGSTLSSFLFSASVEISAFFTLMLIGFLSVSCGFCILFGFLSFMVFWFSFTIFLVSWLLVVFAMLLFWVLFILFSVVLAVPAMLLVLGFKFPVLFGFGLVIVKLSISLFKASSSLTFFEFLVPVILLVALLVVFKILSLFDSRVLVCFLFLGVSSNFGTWVLLLSFLSIFSCVSILPFSSSL